MKIIWEENDIECGRFIIRESYSKGGDNIDFATTVAYKIGYIGDNKRCCLVSLADGLIIEVGSKEQTAEHLNTDKHGYRPLDERTLLRIVTESNAHLTA